MKRWQKLIPNDWDLFGKPISLAYKGQQVYSTLVGRLLSILVIVVTLIAFFQKGLKFQLQSNIGYSISESYIGQNELVDMEKYGYFFGIQDIDPSVAQIKVDHISWSAEGNRTETPIELIPCEEKFRERFQSEISKGNEDKIRAAFADVIRSREQRSIKRLTKNFKCPKMISRPIQGSYETAQF